MNINGKHHHTIWLKENDPKTIQIIDQRLLPFEINELRIWLFEFTKDKPQLVLCIQIIDNHKQMEF